MGGGQIIPTIFRPDYSTTCPPDFQNSYDPVAAKSGTYCGHQTIRGPGFYNFEVTGFILLISRLPLGAVHKGCRPFLGGGGSKLPTLVD